MLFYLLFFMAICNRRSLNVIVGCWIWKIIKQSLIFQIQQLASYSLRTTPAWGLKLPNYQKSTQHGIMPQSHSTLHKSILNLEIEKIWPKVIRSHVISLFGVASIVFFYTAVAMSQRATNYHKIFCWSSHSCMVT